MVPDKRQNTFTTKPLIPTHLTDKTKHPNHKINNPPRPHSQQHQTPTQPQKPNQSHQSPTTRLPTAKHDNTKHITHTAKRYRQ